MKDTEVQKSGSDQTPDFTLRQRIAQWNIRISGKILKRELRQPYWVGRTSNV